MPLSREPLPGSFRSRQLKAREMLSGELEGEDLERYVSEQVGMTTLDRAVAWARGNSFFPLTFGLACCGIEFMHIMASRVDIARFGYEAAWASPRQADLIILSGRVSIKMAPVIRRLWDQMLEPKWAISMGACCSSMGVFNNYALVPSDKFMPISVHVPRLSAATGGAGPWDPASPGQGPEQPARRLARALRRRCPVRRRSRVARSP